MKTNPEQRKTTLNANCDVVCLEGSSSVVSAQHEVMPLTVISLTSAMVL